MGTEDLSESRGLGLAQLRKIRCYVRHRTMVLAELFTASDVSCRCSVSLLRQSTSKDLGPFGRAPRIQQRLPVVGHQSGHPALRELPHTLLTVLLGDEAQSCHRQIVVRVPEPGTSHLGEQEKSGWPTTTPPTPRGCLPRVSLTLGHQRIQVPAHRRGTNLQFGSYRGGGDGPPLQQQPRYFVPRSTFAMVPRSRLWRIPLRRVRLTHRR